MTFNNHVNLTYELASAVFRPDDGYALWRDNDPGNLDENGEPIHYYLQMGCAISMAEEEAPHVWARLIEEGMYVV